MTKAKETYLKKVLNLSLEFDRHIARNPKVLNKIPRGASLVMTIKGDEAFNRESRKSLRSASDNKFVEVQKMGRRWSVGRYSTMENAN